MKRIVLFGVVAVVGTALWAIVTYEHGFAHGIGIDTQLSQEYGFFSGFGTFMLAMLGYTGVIVTLAGKFNCHQPGCWHIGKHHINGSPWCDAHQKNVRPQRSDNELLEEMCARLASISEKLDSR